MRSTRVTRPVDTAQIGSLYSQLIRRLVGCGIAYGGACVKTLSCSCYGRSSFFFI
jgi:hypothetical protein